MRPAQLPYGHAANRDAFPAGPIRGAGAPDNVIGDLCALSAIVYRLISYLGGFPALPGFPVVPGPAGLAHIAPAPAGGGLGLVPGVPAPVNDGIRNAPNARPIKRVRFATEEHRMCMFMFTRSPDIFY